ncbi:glucosamine-6-phosphate deaminase [Piscibacillus sp. B03]|uniref:glucosamine-6-phosphate deaminase n=1 Tax=Piscibacillus sp. B03 TaxID=3457430 RepID=UPI003FCE464D
MDIVQVNSYEKLSNLAATYILSTIHSYKEPVLGLATGSTPIGMYNRLIELYINGEISFKDVTTFNLDEYVGVSRNNENSYYYYMNDVLFRQVDIEDRNIHLPNGNTQDLQQECISYESKINSKGPIHLQILGLGANGHIGFNEPGTSFESETHVVKLDHTTREANSRFFNSIYEVPDYAITMGIATIMRSQNILLLVSGEEKENAYYNLLNGDLSETFPASILQKHPNVTVIYNSNS